MNKNFSNFNPPFPRFVIEKIPKEKNLPGLVRLPDLSAAHEKVGVLMDFGNEEYRLSGYVIA